MRTARGRQGGGGTPQMGLRHRAKDTLPCGGAIGVRVVWTLIDIRFSVSFPKTGKQRFIGDLRDVLGDWFSGDPVVYSVS